MLVVFWGGCTFSVLLRIHRVCGQSFRLLLRRGCTLCHCGPGTWDYRLVFVRQEEYPTNSGRMVHARACVRIGTFCESACERLMGKLTIWGPVTTYERLLGGSRTYLSILNGLSMSAMIFAWWYPVNVDDELDKYSELDIQLSSKLPPNPNYSDYNQPLSVVSKSLPSLNFLPP